MSEWVWVRERASERASERACRTMISDSIIVVCRSAKDQPTFDANLRCYKYVVMATISR